MSMQSMMASLLAACCLLSAHAAPAVAADTAASASAPLAASTPQPTPTAIPFKRGSDVPAASMVGGGAGVLLISVLAIAAVLVLRKRLNFAPLGGAARHLRVLETQRLGPRAMLAVVEFGGKRYLLAQSEQGVNCVDSVVAGEAAP